VLIRTASVAALVLLGLALAGCGTKGSLGFKEKPTTTTSGGTTRTTQGDDSLEDDGPAPPPADLDDPIVVGPGLHHPGCGPTTETPTTAASRPRAPFALVAAPGTRTATAGC
jgi:predicted small lipoprotein YifL